MSQVCNRSKGMITSQIITDSLDLLAKSNEHAQSTLTMPNIMNLSTSDFLDVSECSWKIIFSHLIEGEVPKLKRDGAEMLS